ncbi:hypothetical protein EZI45_29755 [Delftia tsuruhatensis]|uniref:Uncharacterized protein n=1 Tax=Delftia acidovorans TaxID=80866 RepID=A0A7T2S7G0_DELAC|nr:MULTISPECIES: hypothetical protein [Delftia]QPS10323.1 hypothetical protein I6G66_10130 [Delftia acidovorans]TDF22708.1 hypothetical protein EZI45_29755 [Delftia tsuruhatensis]
MSDYNFIYKKLVQSPNDVVGALAYALYKEEKIAYISSFKTEHDRDPNEQELQAFHRVSNGQPRIEAYQMQAQGLLQKFLDDVLASELVERGNQLSEEILQQKLDRQGERQKQFHNIQVREIQRKNGFWKGVGQNIIAAAATTFLTFGVVLVAWMYTEGPNKIISGAWSKFNQTGEPPQGDSNTTPK